MRRVVLDTNILVSATIAREGAPARILAAWRDGEVELATSPVLLDELSDVLTRPRIKKHQWMTEQEVAALREELQRCALHGSGERVATVINDDPDDDYVLSAAVETGADYIVSGDPHLLGLSKYAGIEIIRPVDSLDVLDADGESGN